VTGTGTNSSPGGWTCSHSSIVVGGYQKVYWYPQATSGLGSSRTVDVVVYRCQRCGLEYERDV